MMTEIPSCILSHYLWYNVNIQVDKTCIHFPQFSEKILFQNLLITMALLKNGISLRENTIYIRNLFSMSTTNRLYSRKMEIYH